MYANETWRDVVGYEGRYQVSSFGAVKSYPLEVNSNGKAYIHARSNRALSQGADENGYLRVTLYRHGVKKTHCVHHLVCEAFHGPRPTGLMALHGDGVSTNNNSGNLRWGTAQENSDDAQRHGSVVKGESHPGHRLTESEVSEIRRFELGGGITLRSIASRYGVHRLYVWKIRKGIARAA